MLLAARRLLLGLAQGLELVTREELGVPGDDRRALGDLLLPHANSPAFFRALEEVALQA